MESRNQGEYNLLSDLLNANDMPAARNAIKPIQENFAKLNRQLNINEGHDPDAYSYYLELLLQQLQEAWITEATAYNLLDNLTLSMHFADRDRKKIKDSIIDRAPNKNEEQQISDLIGYSSTASAVINSLTINLACQKQNITVKEYNKYSLIYSACVKQNLPIEEYTVEQNKAVEIYNNIDALRTEISEKVDERLQERQRKKEEALTKIKRYKTTDNYKSSYFKELENQIITKYDFTPQIILSSLKNQDVKKLFDHWKGPTNSAAAKLIRELFTLSGLELSDDDFTKYLTSGELHTTSGELHATSGKLHVTSRVLPLMPLNKKPIKLIGKEMEKVELIKIKEEDVKKDFLEYTEEQREKKLIYLRERGLLEEINPEEKKIIEDKSDKKLISTKPTSTTTSTTQILFNTTSQQEREKLIEQMQERKESTEKKETIEAKAPKQEIKHQEEADRIVESMIDTTDKAKKLITTLNDQIERTNKMLARLEKMRSSKSDSTKLKF